MKVRDAIMNGMHYVNGHNVTESFTLETLDNYCSH